MILKMIFIAIIIVERAYTQTIGYIKGNNNEHSLKISFRQSSKKKKPHAQGLFIHNRMLYTAIAFHGCFHSQGSHEYPLVRGS